MSQHDTLTLREALRSIQYEAASLADAQVIALQALNATYPARAALSATQPAQAKQSEPAEHWHRLYLEKCQQYNDRVAQLGGVIEGLEAQAAQGDWSTQRFNAPVYPPDGTESPFTVINLGSGKVQMGDSIHDGRLPALWFGINGQGMGHEETMNREARPGETLAVVTFANVEGLDVLLDVIQRIRREKFPEAQGVGDKVFLVATGEIYEGQETYERYEGSPPPLCGYEVLYTVPQPAVAQGASEVFTALADHCPVDNGWFNGRAAQGAGEVVPYAYAVYFPDQPTEMLVHDLDDLCEDMTNREHTVTQLYTQPAAGADVLDAGRYRWLRTALADRSNQGKSHWFCSIPEGAPSELDAAIDAAIAASGRQE